MSNGCLFKELSDIIKIRWKKEEHAKTDCNFVLVEKWRKEDSIFYYAIAHILKHKCRATIHGIVTSESDSETEALKKEAIRTIGWADEFFWLSIWWLTGKMKGKPEFKDIEDPYKLFFHALIHLEWADLIREAFFLYRNYIENESRVQITKYGFGIWKKGEYDLPHSLYERSEIRFRNAWRALSHLENADKIRFKNVLGDLGEAIADCRTHYYMGLARLLHSNKETRPQVVSYLEGAQKRANNSKSSKAFIIQNSIEKCKKNQIEDLDYEFMTNYVENKSSLRSIHIIGNWIEDLLQENDTILHPRNIVESNNIPKNQPSTFPNIDAINQIKNVIEENINWLRFVNEDSEKFNNRLNEINERDRKLREGFTDNRPKIASPNNDEWILYVLRDWGSYTPLVSRKREGCTENHAKLGGGGYFLRYKDRGIVIDPGFDYIDHFYQAGLHPAMITDIIVTHDHYDHCASFGPLLNLLYAERSGRKRLDKPNDPKVNFYLCRNVLAQQSRAIVDLRFFGKLEPLTDEDHTDEIKRKHLIIDGKDGLELVTTYTQHGFANGFGQGIGLIFKFENLPNMAITSDTGWFENHKKQSLGELFESHKPDVLILHVGSLKKDELKRSGFYKTHLGARGVFLTIDAVKSCKLAVLSEFGEECYGSRKWYSEKIQNYFKTNEKRSDFRCIPSDRKTCIVGGLGNRIELCNPAEEGKKNPKPLSKKVEYLQANVTNGKNGFYTFE